MIKRKKIGNTTVTINTKTGRQTTSRRSGNITHSQSNQGHNRTTVTIGFGNGWFQRKTTNQNKKTRVNSSKSKATTFLKRLATPSSELAKVEEKPEFIGPPFPVFWKRKSFLQFDISEWILWFLALPFRIVWFIVRWTLILMLLYVATYIIVHLFSLVI
jgi:hypothetical protein